jgi:hypothetical protein
MQAPSAVPSSTQSVTRLLPNFSPVSHQRSSRSSTRRRARPPGLAKSRRPTPCRSQPYEHRRSKRGRPGRVETEEQRGGRTAPDGRNLFCFGQCETARAQPASVSWLYVAASSPAGVRASTVLTTFASELGLLRRYRVRLQPCRSSLPAIETKEKDEPVQGQFVVLCSFVGG